MHKASKKYNFRRPISEAVRFPRDLQRYRTLPSVVEFALVDDIGRVTTLLWYVFVQTNILLFYNKLFGDDLRSQNGWFLDFIQTILDPPLFLFAKNHSFWLNRWYLSRAWRVALFYFGSGSGRVMVKSPGSGSGSGRVSSTVNQDSWRVYLT